MINMWKNHGENRWKIRHVHWFWLCYMFNGCWMETLSSNNQWVFLGCWNVSVVTVKQIHLEKTLKHVYIYILDKNDETTIKNWGLNHQHYAFAMSWGFIGLIFSSFPSKSWSRCFCQPKLRDYDGRYTCQHVKIHIKNEVDSVNKQNTQLISAFTNFT